MLFWQLALWSSLAFMVLSIDGASTRPRLNVLHIVCDDLRSDLGLYNKPVLTPHLDALAKKSMVFQNANCQIAVCSPSRNSFLSGLRPAKTKTWNFIDNFRGSRPKAVSFPEYFKEQTNTLALGAGKLYHYTVNAASPPNHDEPTSWSPEADGSHEYFEPDWQYCVGGRGTVCVSDTLPDMEDGLTLGKAIEHLRRVKAEGKHFYVGVGFHRPHAPYIVPKSFYDLYDGPLPLAKYQTMPKDVPDVACIANFWIDYPNGTGPFIFNPKTKPLPQVVQYDLRRHYYAAISYVDSLVGKLLQTLKDLQFADSTVVVFHSDHGYFLGESGEWEKKMLFENTVRVPLIIHDPLHPQHRRVEDIVELIDIYPTVAALSGLPVPAFVDGRDLSILFEQPAGRVATGLHDAPAFAQYPRCPPGGSPNIITNQACLYVPASGFNFMGHSVRTAQWRYTEWRLWDGDKLCGVWDQTGLIASELYNHSGDFADSTGDFDYKQVNLAAGSGLQHFAQEIAELSALLKAHFDPTLPVEIVNHQTDRNDVLNTELSTIAPSVILMLLLTLLVGFMAARYGRRVLRKRVQQRDAPLVNMAQPEFMSDTGNSASSSRHRGLWSQEMATGSYNSLGE